MNLNGQEQDQSEELEAAEGQEQEAEVVEEAAEEQDATGAEESGEEGGEEAGAESAEGAAAEGVEEKEAALDERGTMPVKSHLAYKQKAKQQLAAFRAEVEKHKAEIAKAKSLGEIDPQEYRRQKNALDKLKAGLEKYPEFDAVLAAFEQGLDPDLRALAQALEPRVKALTTQDPATQRALHELRQQTQKMQAQQMEYQLERQKTRDDAEIRKLHGGDEKSAAKFLQTVDAIARASAKGIPDEYFSQWAATARLEIAKAIAPLSKVERETLLKKQQDIKPVKTGAGLPVPKKGAKPTTADPMPNQFSEPEKYSEWLGRQKEMKKQA